MTRLAWIAWTLLAALALGLAVSSCRDKEADHDRHLPAAALGIPWLVILPGWLAFDWIFWFPFAVLSFFFGILLSVGMLFSRQSRKPRIMLAHVGAIALNVATLTSLVLSAIVVNTRGF